MRDIYLIRHGVPQFPDGTPLCIGTTDLPLSQEGRDQMGRAREIVAAGHVAAVYSSDLRRAADSAAIVAGDLPVQKSPILREVSMGIWEGLSFDDIRDRYPLEYEQRGKDLANFAPPGGLPFALVQSRAIRAMDRILAETEGNIAIVAHAGLNRSLLCYIQGIRLSQLETIPQPYGCINHIQAEGNKLTFIETIEP